MRKQVCCEQISQQLAAITLRNIFGGTLNLIEDKIKKSSGKWNPHSKKYEITVQNISILTKQILTDLDRTLYIDRIPNSAINTLLQKYRHTQQSKIKRRLYIDQSTVLKFPFIAEQIIDKIMNNERKQGCRAINRILVLCAKFDLGAWQKYLGARYAPGKVQRVLDLGNKNSDYPEGIWLLAYEQLGNQLAHLRTLKREQQFPTLIADNAEILCDILTNKSSYKVDPKQLKKYIESQSYLFMITHRLKICPITSLMPLIESILLLQESQAEWFKRRYRKQNYRQLQYILEEFGVYKYIQRNQISQEQQVKYFNDGYFAEHALQISETGLEKLKGVSRKYGANQSSVKQILENIHSSKHRNKTDRKFIQNIIDCLNLQKHQSIKQSIFYFAVTLKLKIAILIQSLELYRIIENYLCEHQIAYCHFQHPRQVIDFNINPSILICLIKAEMLITFSQSRGYLQDRKDIINDHKIKEEFLPEQYHCLSSTSNLLIPDINWFQQKNYEKAISQCFIHKHIPLIRHYFLIKGSYQQKWFHSYYQGLINQNRHFSQQNCDQEQTDSIESEDEKLLNFQDMQLAEVMEQYSHCRHEGGVCDIDDEFDRFQFEAMKQRQEHQKRKIKKKSALDGSQQKCRKKSVNKKPRQKNKEAFRCLSNNEPETQTATIFQSENCLEGGLTKKIKLERNTPEAEAQTTQNKLTILLKKPL